MTEPYSPAVVADRLAIEDLLTRYAVAVDTGDWDALDTVFTPDASIDYTSAGGIKGGRDEVKKWLAEVLAMFPLRQHIICSRHVTLDGDSATVRAYFINPMGMSVGENKRFSVMGGYYHHRLTRTSDGWRSAELVEEFLYDAPFAPDALPALLREHPG